MNWHHRPPRPDVVSNLPENFEELIQKHLDAGWSLTSFPGTIKMSARRWEWFKKNNQVIREINRKYQLRKTEK